VHSGGRLSIRTTAMQLNLHKKNVKRPEMCLDVWIIQHDNVPAHKARSADKFLTQKTNTEM
jgi:hypothetical protein